MSINLDHESQSKSLRVKSMPSDYTDDITFSRNNSKDTDADSELGLDYFVKDKGNEEETFDSTSETSSLQDSGEKENYFDERFLEKDNGESLLSSEEILRQKIDYLNKIKRMKKYGRNPTVNLSIEHTLDDIKAEYLGMKKDAETESGIQQCKYGILFCVGLIEGVNKTFDLANLDGWQSSVEGDMSTGSWDSLLEEVYDKYLSNLQADPLLKLVGMIVLSGITQHISNQSKKTFNPRSKESNMTGPSINTDDLLKQLNDSDTDSDTCSVTADVPIKVKTPVKRGRPKKK
ncbi:MAG TPA: hypothetical protein V6C58_13995 [Allocoleopsis sp.]